MNRQKRPLRIYYELVSKDGSIYRLGYDDTTDLYQFSLAGFSNMMISLPLLEFSKLAYQLELSYLEEDGSPGPAFLDKNKMIGQLESNQQACEVADITNDEILIYLPGSEINNGKFIRFSDKVSISEEELTDAGTFLIGAFIPNYLLNGVDKPRNPLRTDDDYKNLTINMLTNKYMEEEIKKGKMLAVDGRTKEQKREDRDKAELERQEKRAALKAALADELCREIVSDVTRLPLSGRLKSKDGTIYHMKEGVLTALYLDGFETQTFLLDSQDLYRFIWQHKLSYLTPGGCIKKLFQDATAADAYLKLDGLHCVWSPVSGFWTRLNSELLNNGKIADETNSLPTGSYMAVASDVFNISNFLRVIKERYKLSNWQLAQRVGCDVATIIFFKNDQRVPSERFLNKLADAFPEYGQSISKLRKKDCV